MDSGNVWLIEVKHAIDGQVVLCSKFFNLAKKYMLNCVNAETLADWKNASGIFISLACSYDMIQSDCIKSFDIVISVILTWR